MDAENDPEIGSVSWGSVGAVAIGLSMLKVTAGATGCGWWGCVATRGLSSSDVSVEELTVEAVVKFGRHVVKEDGIFSASEDAMLEIQELLGLLFVACRQVASVGRSGSGAKRAGGGGDVKAMVVGGWGISGLGASGRFCCDNISGIMANDDK